MSHYLVLGSTVLIALMIGLVGHAVWQIKALKSRMGDIVDVRNLKIQLATDLQEASYNRHSNLVYQVLADDAFERDENYKLYIKWGYLVGAARNKLKALQLDDFERDNLLQQDKLVKQIVELQDEISDLAAREMDKDARDLMSMQLRPLNLEYTDIVEGLRRHERDLTRAALEKTRQATDRAINLHLTLGGILILLAVVITNTIRRVLNRNANIIQAQFSELEQAGSLLEHQATHDPLTGLANRALFYHRVTEAIQHAREEGFGLAVMYIDLDDFKQINDLHGHAAGDALLLAVARRLQLAVRKTDTSARLGGDEFALLCVGIDPTESTVDFCKKIEREVSQPIYFDGTMLQPACSLGVAVYPNEGFDLDALVRTADTRMYAVKRARKSARGQ